MGGENLNQESRLKNINETRNYFIVQVEQSGLMSNKLRKGFYKSKLYWTLSYFSLCD